MRASDPFQPQDVEIVQEWLWGYRGGKEDVMGTRLHIRLLVIIWLVQEGRRLHNSYISGLPWRAVNCSSILSPPRSSAVRRSVNLPSWREEHDSTMKGSSLTHSHLHRDSITHYHTSIHTRVHTQTPIPTHTHPHTPHTPHIHTHTPRTSLVNFIVCRANSRVGESTTTRAPTFDRTEEVQCTQHRQ